MQVDLYNGHKTMDVGYCFDKKIKLVAICIFMFIDCAQLHCNIQMAITKISH